MKIKNVSPVGALFVPALNTEIAADETVEVPDDLAAAMLRQADNFQPVTEPTKEKK